MKAFSDKIEICTTIYIYKSNMLNVLLLIVFSLKTQTTNQLIAADLFRLIV